MTSVRMSFVFAPEDEFKGGIGSKKWIAPPPGSYFSSTGTRQTSAIYTTGSKKWETTAYGAYSGTWDWTFMLDYHYLEPLMLAFDTVNDLKWVENPTYDAFIGVGNKFVFKKGKTGRVPSFTVRRKILHTVAGGDTDELVELYGCVVSTISFTRSATTSQYQVQMSGTYANEEMRLGELPKTDYQEYDGELVEYSCVSIGDSVDSTIDTANYVANTDSISISIQNNTNMVFNTCTPFATQYYEDRNQFQVSTSCYSTDPQAYKTRMYSGGFTNEKLKPLSKGLKPMEKMFITSFNGLVEDSEASSTGELLRNAYRDSDKSIMFEISKLVVKSMKWVNGDGSKLTDSLSSVDCKDVVLTITCKGDDQRFVKHTLESYGLDGELAKEYIFTSFEDSSVKYKIRKGENLSILATFELPVGQEIAEYGSVEDAINVKTKGYEFISANRADDTAAVHLNGLIQSPNIVDGIVGVLIVTKIVDNIPYIDISGAPGLIGDYYLAVANTKRKDLYAIRIRVY